MFGTGPTQMPALLANPAFLADAKGLTEVADAKSV